MPWWIRAYLGFAAFQGLGIGLTGLILPAEMQIPLRISPLNTRFVAALYIAGGVGVIGAAFARRRQETRLFVLGFGFVTAVILVLTLLHWPDFMADTLPHRPVWIFDYVVDPILALVVVQAAHLWPPRHGTRHALSGLLLVEAGVFGLLGLALLFLPDVVAAAWPWLLPPLLGQVYGAFFATFGLGAFLAARESERRAIRLFLAASLVLGVLVLGVSILHFDRFKPEPVTWLWFAAWATASVAFGVAVRRRV
jgi:hypothetical protein